MVSRWARSISRCFMAEQGREASHQEHVCPSVDGFAKNERANISDKELKALKLLATQSLGYTNPALVKAIEAGELIEVHEHG